jgi:ribosomal protein S8
MPNVKNRSLDKMKDEAAMLGANAILISDAQSRGNHYGTENIASQSTQTVLFGQAFSNETLDLGKLNDNLKAIQVVPYQTFSLNRNDFSPKMKMAITYDKNRKPVAKQIHSLTERDGKPYVTISDIGLKNNELEVVSLRNGILTLVEKHKSSIYNYILHTEESDIMKSMQPALELN